MTPHSSGRNGSAIDLGHIYNRRLGYGRYLTIRPAYTDKLATDSGKIPDSTLHMAKAEFVQFGANLRLQKLTIIEIENLRAAKFESRFEPGRVWYLAAGLDRSQNQPDTPLAPFFRAGIGRNHLFTDKVNGYAMAQLNATESSASFNKLYAVVRLGLVSQIGNRAKLYVEHAAKHQKNDHIFNESSAGVRYKLSSQIDVTLNFHHTSEDDERLMFGLQRNF